MIRQVLYTKDKDLQQKQLEFVNNWSNDQLDRLDNDATKTLEKQLNKKKTSETSNKLEQFFK